MRRLLILGGPVPQDTVIHCNAIMDNTPTPFDPIHISLYFPPSIYRSFIGMVHTFDHSERGQLLVSTAICHNQAFCYGKSVLAFQVHPEATGGERQSGQRKRKIIDLLADLDEQFQ
jgi:hypothetical protein